MVVTADGKIRHRRAAGRAHLATALAPLLPVRCDGPVIVDESVDGDGVVILRYQVSRGGTP
jgi:hypothetical protein